MINILDLDFNITDSFPDINEAKHNINNIILIRYNDQLLSAEINIFTSKDYFTSYNKNAIYDLLGIKIDHIKYHINYSEKDMILNFLEFSSIKNINELHGYNINGFDFDYLIKRSSKLKGINKNLFNIFTTIDLMISVKDLNPKSYTLKYFIETYFPIINRERCKEHLKYLECALYTIKVWQYFNEAKSNKEDTNTGYHLTKIKKGVLGEFSKIKEEFLEAEDAIEQNNSVMALVELSDLLGAIEAYAKTFNMTLNDLLTMKDATKRAFETGRRK